MVGGISGFDFVLPGLLGGRSIFGLFLLLVLFETSSAKVGAFFIDDGLGSVTLLGDLLGFVPSGLFFNSSSRNVGVFLIGDGSMAFSGAPSSLAAVTGTSLSGLAKLVVAMSSVTNNSIMFVLSFDVF